jgi:ferredoxin
MAALDAASPDAAALKTLVAVCAANAGPDVIGAATAEIELGRRMSAAAAGVVFVRTEGLCADPDAVRAHISSSGAKRLALGLCPGEFSQTAVQQAARRAGLDPFGVQVIDYRRWRDRLGDPDGQAGAVRALKAAVARARAFTGSTPEQAKAVFTGLTEPVTRRALFHIPRVRYVPVPAIDRDACVAPDGCEQCVKACPHGALSSEAGVIAVSRDACQSCGVCVEACPQRAVEFPGFSAPEIEAQAEALTDGGGDGPRQPVAFACRNATAGPADGWQTVPVACIGMVPAAAILQAVARGAPQVGLYRCQGDCPNRASERVAGRVDYCKEALRATGNDPGRVILLTPADQGQCEPPASFPPGRDNAPRLAGRMRAFGAGAAARGLLGLAALSTTTPLPFSHEFSPVGLPQINAAACTGCGTCASACPANAISQQEKAGAAVITVDPARCIACGECAATCPERERGAITVSPVTDVAALRKGPAVQFRGTSVQCRNCGRAFTTREVLDRLKAMLGDDYREAPLGTLCPDCRGR